MAALSGRRLAGRRACRARPQGDIVRERRLQNPREASTSVAWRTPPWAAPNRSSSRVCASAGSSLAARPGVRRHPFPYQLAASAYADALGNLIRHHNARAAGPPPVFPRCLENSRTRASSPFRRASEFRFEAPIGAALYTTDYQAASSVRRTRRDPIWPSSAG